MRRCGLRFGDPALLLEALTHRSYLNELGPGVQAQDNQRLEYLGDAVLGLLAAELLYRTDAAAPEGDLTRRRAALVSGPSLAALAAECGLGAALRLGRGAERTGMRENAKALADGFEAVVAALYLDQGMDAARAWVMPMLERRMQSAEYAASMANSRVELQERAQAVLGETPEYVTVGERWQGDEHRYIVEALIGGRSAGVGEGRSKAEAALAAARAALARWPALFDEQPDDRQSMI